jgi:DNA-binding transcriptional regulator YdaS (Cro superfamily)
MKPSAFARKNRLGGFALARLIGVSPSLGCLLIKGTRRVSPILARQIERRTKGGITVHDLRPDVFGPPPRKPRALNGSKKHVDDLSTSSQPEQSGPETLPLSPQQQEPTNASP